MGEGRQTVLELKMDRMADSVSGQTVVDPKGYLTDLQGMKVASDADISDIKKVGYQKGAAPACFARAWRGCVVLRLVAALQRVCVPGATMMDLQIMKRRPPLMRISRA